MTRTFLVFALLSMPLPAMAAQNLIGTPYPSTSPGSAPLNPPPMGTGGSTQTNMPTPYPQATGASQGNPATVTGGPQQTAPSTFREKYGVDQK